MENAAANDPASEDPVAIRVWDLPVRLVHWAMALLLVVLLVTAKIGDGAMAWHMRAGEAMLALVLFRLLWGFAGTRRARSLPICDRCSRRIASSTSATIRWAGG